MHVKFQGDDHQYAVFFTLIKTEQNAVAGSFLRPYFTDNHTAQQVDGALPKTLGMYAWSVY